MGDTEPKSVHAFYFSHYANARRRQEILAMMSIYGAKGYGWYWIITEMMCESESYTIEIARKHIYAVLAKEMDCSQEDAREFVDVCVQEFHLFTSDGKSIWSEDLDTCVAIVEGRSKSGRKAAFTRWHPNEAPAAHDRTTPAMRAHSASTAEAMQVKETKAQKSKEREREISCNEKEQETPNIALHAQGVTNDSPAASPVVDDMNAALFSGNESNIYDKYRGLVVTHERRKELMGRYVLSDQGFTDLYCCLCDKLDSMGEPPENNRQFIEEFFQEHFDPRIHSPEAEQPGDEPPASGILF